MLLFVQVEYASTLVNKYAKYQSFKLDSVYPLRGLPNEFLFGRLQLNDLASKGKCNSIITLHKLLTGKIDCTQLDN